MSLDTNEFVAEGLARHFGISYHDGPELRHAS